MKKLTLAFMFVLFMCGLRAQSYELVIRLNDQSETTWTDESLRNIYFIDVEDILVVVENESLVTHQYNFADINKIYFKNSVNVTELNKDEASFVFPNPANDNIRIFGIENQDVEIFSADGKFILKERYEGKSIDVSSLPQGLYLIKTNGQTLKFNKI
ncbi:MAG: T9SS type A sorting domain-containing protein [Bacteroidales bacterium]|nr:T9SS type A sorting domain-containing protein [Bacteroidales bacterium]